MKFNTCLALHSDRLSVWQLIEISLCSLQSLGEVQLWHLFRLADNKAEGIKSSGSIMAFVFRRAKQ